MTLTMNQDCINSRNEVNAMKGEKVELISDGHLPVLLVENGRGQTFSVRVTGTNYQELKKKQSESNNV